MRTKYGDKLIADGWKIRIKKATEMLKTETFEGCEELDRQKLLDSLEEKYYSRIKLKNFLKHRPFLIAYVFRAWTFYENLIALPRYIKQLKFSDDLPDR